MVQTLSAPTTAVTYSIDCRPNASNDRQAEWLLTNGLGGFAMGSVDACNTRRYHGLFIAALDPPVKRISTIASMGESLSFDDRTVELHTHCFADAEAGFVRHPQGADHLVRFEKGLSCRWYYRVGPFMLIRQLHLIWRSGLAVVRYLLEPAQRTDDLPDEAVLQIRPFVAMRGFHGLRRADRTGQFDVKADGVNVDITVDGGPTLHLAADRGSFAPLDEWWYDFRYPAETERGQDDTEDLFVPGCFEHRFSNLRGAAPRGGHELRLCFGFEPIDWRRCSEDDGRAAHLQAMADAVTAQASHQVGSVFGAPTDPGRVACRQLPALVAAADDFVVERIVDGQAFKTILAGYPWFADWGRDAMIALPGLLLVTGRHDEAAQTLLTFARHIRDGLVPNRFDDEGGDPHYNTVDASLWFIHAAMAYTHAAGDEATWRKTLGPACLEIIDAYSHATRFDIRMLVDGLIAAGNAGTQLTWMDAARDGAVFTPRHGLAVEINALWYHALVGVGELLGAYDSAEAQRLTELAETVQRSFVRTFWCDELGYLIDHVAIDLDGGADGQRAPDRSLRPNQVFAVSLPHSPLPSAKQRKIMRIVRQQLLTPMGLRTLPVDDEHYHGQYAGSMFERDEAYHQGTVWPWLIGPYVEGWLRAYDFSDTARREAHKAIEPLLGELSRHCLGQLHEVCDGDPPHRPDGCIAQAWSVAELLRAAVLIESPGEP